MPSPIRDPEILDESLIATGGVISSGSGPTPRRAEIEAKPINRSRRNPASAAEDIPLLQALARKEEQALVTLYRKYARLVFSLALRILRDEGEAEESVQEVFLHVWQKAALFDPERGTFESWLTTLAHHRAIDTLRTKRFRQRGVETKLDPQDLEAMNSAPFTLERTGLTESIEHDERSRISEAMAQIPPEQKQVLELAYYEGYSQSEIAEKLHLPLGTVKTRMRQGMIRLSRFVKDLRYGNAELET